MRKVIATWNVSRGRKLFRIINELKRYEVDIALLQECDVGMARSDNVHVPRAIADGLRCDYRMAIEFEEHGLGNGGEQQRLGEAAFNRHGLHCNAIIAAGLPRITNIIELTQGEEWRDSDQPRNGGRTALACKMAGVHYVSVHLENRTTPDRRAEDMARLLKSLDKIGAQRVIIGGDMNNKQGYEPLFQIAESFGYCWADANRDVGRWQDRRLDWFFYRGVAVANPQTIDAAGISDHDLMLSEVSV